MQRLKQILLLTGIFITTLNIQAQKDTSYEFSLDEAVNYAMENNPDLKNATLDVKKSKKKVWETTATGLPHIDGEAGYSYMLTVPDQIEQFSMIGDIFGYMYQDNPQLANQLFGPPGDDGEQSSTDDLRESITMDLTISQLIFSGPYIVGLQASRVYKSLSEQQLIQEKKNIKETVINTYYMVLIAEENKLILDSIYDITQKNYADMQKRYENGLVEETAADQLKLTLQQIESSVKTLQRQAYIAHRMLNYQLGLPFSDSVKLTESLDQVINQLRLDASLENNFNVNQITEYEMLKTQEELKKLDWQRRKTEALPTISAFYQHHEELNDDAFSFTPPDLIGLNISIPIFSSLERSSKVSQAKIELEKAKNQTEHRSRGLKLKYREAKSGYMTALDQYQLKKDNRRLAEKIYQQTNKKHQQGMASSLDLSQAQNQYLTAQREYYQSVSELVDAKLKLDKLLNQ